MNDLIYDRTAADVVYAKAHPGSATALKGCYNVTDLNRVGEWCKTLADLLRAQGYRVTVAPKTDWTMTNMPSQTALAQYLTTVATLKAAYIAVASPIWVEYSRYV